MTTKKQVPAAEGLFVQTPEGARLVGAHCRGCGSYFFPKFAQLHKPDCEGGPVEDHQFSRTGELISYTVEYFPPPPPFIKQEPFQPIALGTVAFPEGLQIPGQLTGMDFNDLKTGIQVEVTLGKLYEDQDGNDAMTWRFKPVGK